MNMKVRRNSTCDFDLDVIFQQVLQVLKGFWSLSGGSTDRHFESIVGNAGCLDGGSRKSKRSDMGGHG